ncbi:xylose isomerase [Paenibacillus selenitireducens]|uniref:Xylose isomerase n=1 Tax=Paenibacillus selenitireducens TaxID=1324314 RepID=A0A1T2XGL7_9BACL|nr:TIM barrel protein [Paenibacillus selenitireducens]OPA79034.1 xylose isomerase [Paenibacillus selenitireducens]
MKISIEGFSFFHLLQQEMIDTFGYLESLKYRYRVDAAGLWNGFFADLSEEICKLKDAEYIRKIKLALLEREMELPNLAVDGAHLWDPNPEKRELLYQNALAHLDIAEYLGARSVRIDTGGHGSTDMTEEQFEYTVMRYQEFAQRAADGGYRIGPENHMGPSRMPKLMEKLAQAVNHPAYGILLHMGRWDSDADIGDSLLAPWVFHVHLDPKHVKPHQIEERMQVLFDHGYEGYWGVEYYAQAAPYAEIESYVSAVKAAYLKQMGATLL